MNKKGEIASSLALVGLFFILSGVFLGSKLGTQLDSRIGISSKADEACYKSTASILFYQKTSDDLQFGINTVVYGVTTFNNKITVPRNSDLGTFDNNYNLPDNQKGKLAEYSLQLPTGYSITNGYCKDIAGNACVAATWQGNTIKNIALNCGSHVDYGWSVKRNSVPSTPGSCTYKTRVRVYENQINDASLIKFDETFGDSWKAVNNKQMELKFKNNTADIADKLLEYPNARFDGVGNQYSKGETASVRLRGPNDDQWDVKQVYCKNNSSTINGCPKNIDSQNLSPQRLIDGFTVDCGIDIEYGWVLQKLTTTVPNTPTLPKAPKTPTPTNPPTAGPNTPNLPPKGTTITIRPKTPTPTSSKCTCQKINQPNLSEGFCAPGCSAFKTNGNSCEKNSDCTAKKSPTIPTQKPTAKETAAPTITKAEPKAANTCVYVDLGDRRHLQTASRIVFAPIGFASHEEELYRNLVQQAIASILKTNLGSLTNYLSFSYVDFDSKIIRDLDTLSAKAVDERTQSADTQLKAVVDLCTAKYVAFLVKQDFRSFAVSNKYTMISTNKGIVDVGAKFPLLIPDIVPHELGHIIPLLADEYEDASKAAKFKIPPSFGIRPGERYYNCSYDKGFVSTGNPCTKWAGTQGAECHQECYYSSKYYRPKNISLMRQGTTLELIFDSVKFIEARYKSPEAMSYNTPSLLSWEKILKDNAAKEPAPFQFNELHGPDSASIVENKIIAVSAQKNVSGKWAFGEVSLKNGFVTEATLTDTNYLTLQAKDGRGEVVREVQIPATSYMIVEGEGESEIRTTSIAESFPFDESYTLFVLLDANKKVLAETKITPSNLSTSSIESLQLQLVSQDFTSAINLRIADVDLNGTVNTLDYLKIQNGYGQQFTETNGSTLDLTKDGRINSEDLSSIIKYLGQSTN